MSSIRQFLVLILLATITLFNFIAALKGYQNGIDNAQSLFDRKLENLSHVIIQFYQRSLPHVGIPSQVIPPRQQTLLQLH